MWPVQSIKIVTEKRNNKAFNQYEQRNETALPLLLSVRMPNGRFHQYKFAKLVVDRTSIIPVKWNIVNFEGNLQRWLIRFSQTEIIAFKKYAYKLRALL